MNNGESYFENGFIARDWFVVIFINNHRMVDPLLRGTFGR